jgi:hypothetical protein
MKTHSLLILAGLAISFGLPGFAQQKDAVDPKVEQQIRLLAAKYDEAQQARCSRRRCTLLTGWGLGDSRRNIFHGLLSGRAILGKSARTRRADLAAYCS